VFDASRNGNNLGRELSQKMVVTRGLGQWERRAGSYHVVRVDGQPKPVFFLLTPEEHREWELSRERELQAVAG
jgi:hypothetical protein